MEPEHVKASNEPVQKPSEMKHENVTPFTADEKTLEVSSSSSSPPPPNSPLEPYNDENSKSPLYPEQNLASSPELEPTAMTSPPIQTTGQPPGYDPNRIPASIFSSKTGSPADWSATSNESLFSIHMGNNSFSRDYAILFGKSGELPKLEDWNGSQSNPFIIPGELPRLEEWNNSPQPPNNQRPVSEPKHNEFTTTLPTVMEASSHEESSRLSNGFNKKEEVVSPKFVSGQTVENRGTKDIGVSGDEAQNGAAANKTRVPETNYNSTLSNPKSLASPSNLSDASGHSGSSFAFPVLGNTESGKNESIKVVPENPKKPEKDEPPEAQGSPQETPATTSGTRWFSCFSCWPRFC